MELYDEIVNPQLLVRRITVVANHLEEESSVVEKTGSTDIIVDLYNEFVAQQCMLQFVKSGRVAVPRESIGNLTEVLFNEDEVIDLRNRTPLEIRELGIRKMRLMTNNPSKKAGLEGYGLTIEEIVPLVIQPNEYNERYLQTKKERMGHTLNFNK